MIKTVRKRNNEIVPFKKEKITWAIFKAATAVGGDDFLMAQNLCDQDELQSLYTGGTVLHIYLGESLPDINVAKRLIRSIFNSYKLPYISLTPSFSVCNSHGYIRGEQFVCAECGAETEVWSRVVGYLRPVNNFNKGKKEEYFERKKYAVSGCAKT